MDKFCLLLALALIVLSAGGSLQPRPKVRRAVSNSNRRYQCGIKKRQVEGLITNGLTTKLGEWPWHGALFHRKNRYSKEYKCGATLINQNFVITAGHCVVDRESGYEVNAKSVTVDFGYVQLFSSSSHGQSHGVLEIFVHPKFEKDSNKHDIAVLSLKTAVRFSDFVLPICVRVPRSDKSIRDIIGQQGRAVGWGLTENDETSTNLKLAILPIVDHAECLATDPDLFGPLIYPGMFCAGFRNGTSVCNGDSGGGMYINEGNRWFLRGITSFSGTREDGSNKCDVKNYAGFMNVQYYASWVRKLISGEDELPNESMTEQTTTAQSAAIWPVAESPREIPSPTNHVNYRQRESNSSCPSGQPCVPFKLCIQMQQSRGSVVQRPTQICEITEHDSVRVQKVCCPISECGQRRISSRVTLTPTNPFSKEYPWMVRLKSSQDIFVCQGTLVSRRFVLISAYCKTNGTITSARLGNGGPSRCDFPSTHCVDIAVKSITNHPRLDVASISDRDSNYNIALAELKKQ
nr:transmembrane protease serine 9-like [Aedes albopictus]